LNDLLCNADLHLLFQKDTVIDTVMPSKILGMMASAKPSIVTGHHESEIKSDFEISQGGFYYSGSDKMAAITSQIKNLIENPSDCVITGRNARKFIIEKYAMNIVLGQFQQDIEAITNINY